MTKSFFKIADANAAIADLSQKIAKLDPTFDVKAEQRTEYKISAANERVIRLAARLTELQGNLEGKAITTTEREAKRVMEQSRSASPALDALSTKAQLWAQYHQLSTDSEQRAFWTKHKSALTAQEEKNDSTPEQIRARELWGQYKRLETAPQRRAFYLQHRAELNAQ